MGDIDLQKERQWAVFCHLTALLALFKIPLGHILGPLIIWLWKKDTFPLVNEQGKESLNFQISFTIYAVIVYLLCFVYIGFLLILPIIAFDVVCVIVASIKIANGDKFKYPLAIRLIK